MKQIELLKTYQRSIITGLVFAGIILTYLVLVIHPYEKTRVSLDQELYVLNERVKEQKALAPILIKLLKRSEIKMPVGLPFPEKKKVTRDGTDRIPMVFQELAQKSNLKLKGFGMDLKSFANDSGFLEVRIVLNGLLSDFQTFIKRLYDVPYVENIERLIIRTVQGEKVPEFELNVSLVRE